MFIWGWNLWKTLREKGFSQEGFEPSWWHFKKNKSFFFCHNVASFVCDLTLECTGYRLATKKSSYIKQQPLVGWTTFQRKSMISTYHAPTKFSEKFSERSKKNGILQFAMRTHNIVWFALFRLQLLHWEWHHLRYHVQAATLQPIVYYKSSLMVALHAVGHNNFLKKFTV